ncbi:putative transferase [Klebsiella michiganensis]|nr:putative transferase [Klebsiella michiganensis]
MYGSVKVWQETITLPTWTTGAEDPNPMFLEKRVYQGSSGNVYPYGVIDTLTGEREMRDYQAVWMENDFIRIMLLPELADVFTGRMTKSNSAISSITMKSLSPPW